MESSFSSREPDVLILFGALGGVMVGAVFYVVAVGVIRRLFWQGRSARPIERSERVFLQQQRLPKQSRLMSTRALARGCVLHFGQTPSAMRIAASEDGVPV